MAITNSSVTIGVTSTLVLDAPSTKRFTAILSNDSSQVMYLALGAAAELNKGIRLGIGEKFVIERLDEENAIVNAICAAGSANLCVFDEYY